MRIKRKTTPKKEQKKKTLCGIKRERKRTRDRQKKLGRVIFREWEMDSFGERGYLERRNI